jgi:ABC-type nitrate/sulfonate/bicarbonate transport system permease component
MASLEAVRAMPPICLVPVALLLFGFSVRMELTIIVYASAWPVMLNTIDGVRGVRPEVLEVARMLRLSRLQTLRKIVVPAALPLTIVGLRLALSFALVLAIVAEVAGNPSGLGNAIVSAQQALRPDEMFAYVLAIGALGVTLNAAFNLLAARVVAIPGGARTFARPA